MGFKSAIESYKANGLRYFTPKRAYVFIRSLIRGLFGMRLSQRKSMIFSEIMMYKQLTCNDCYVAGKCKVCKCPITELFSSMDVGCSDGKFPAFERSKDWFLIKYHLKNGKFKKAIRELLKPTKSWDKGWLEYKSDKNIFFNLMEL